MADKDRSRTPPPQPASCAGHGGQPPKLTAVSCGGGFDPKAQDRQLLAEKETNPIRPLKFKRSYSMSGELGSIHFAAESIQQPALSKTASRSLLRNPSSHLLADKDEQSPTERCGPVTRHALE